MPRNSPQGWYLDPEHADQERFWDGAKWTPRTRPATAHPAPSADTVVQRVKGRHVGLVAAIGLILVIVVICISIAAHSGK